MSNENNKWISLGKRDGFNGDVGDLVVKMVPHVTRPFGPDVSKENDYQICYGNLNEEGDFLNRTPAQIDYGHKITMNMSEVKALIAYHQKGFCPACDEEDLESGDIICDTCFEKAQAIKGRPKCPECFSVNLELGGFSGDVMTPSGMTGLDESWGKCNDCEHKWRD